MQINIELNGSKCYIGKMGRPKGFAREEVLDKTVGLFLRKGFADTTVQDLEKTTGVNKSGLYSEFKDKDDLFLATLKYYTDRTAAAEMLNRQPLGWKNIETFLKAKMECTGQKGCLIVNSIREVSALPPQARTIINRHLDHVKALLLKNMKAEKTKTDPELLVSMLLTFNSGLCLEQNLGPSDILERVEQFLSMLKKA